jgi:hypothetical protein
MFIEDMVRPQIGQESKLTKKTCACSLKIMTFKFLQKKRYKISIFFGGKYRGCSVLSPSIDCMHWVWKYCPIAWAGQFQDKDKERSIILEAIADKSLWIWHAYFGMPSSNNDVIVLDRSPFVNNMLHGPFHDLSFVVNGKQYPCYYLLADGIYTQWSCFVQTIHAPQDDKRAHFSKMQESTRKDVKRCFGVLQG